MMVAAMSALPLKADIRYKPVAVLITRKYHTPIMFILLSAFPAPAESTRSNDFSKHFPSRLRRAAQ